MNAAAEKAGKSKLLDFQGKTVSVEEGVFEGRRVCGEVAQVCFPFAVAIATAGPAVNAFAIDEPDSPAVAADVFGIEVFGFHRAPRDAGLVEPGDNFGRGFN